MKRITFFLMIITSIAVFSQDEKIPEGWDKIILEGEIAYMNLINGEVSKTLPKSAAKEPEEVVEFEPTKIHYVKKGETFSKIARKYNMTLAQLFRLNNVEDFDVIEVGQEVVIGYQEEGETNDFTENNNNTSEYFDNENYHTVKTGETLYRISKNSGISIDKIKRLNSLNSNNIYIGQKLRLIE